MREKAWDLLSGRGKKEGSRRPEDTVRHAWLRERAGEAGQLLGLQEGEMEEPAGSGERPPGTSSCQKAESEFPIKCQYGRSGGGALWGNSL